MSTMSQAEFARRHGVSRKSVTLWKRNGLVVMRGDSVDVEASDEMLRMYRNEHDGRAQRGQPKPVTRVATAQGNAARRSKVTTGRVQLTLGEIERRLRDLDWTQTFDWSAAAQEQRARLAAKCVGFEAVESELRDDGHWGAFQLRDPRWIRDGKMLDGAVIAGYGFDASDLEVLRVCREEVLPGDDDPAAVYTIDVALLPMLAFPHHEADRQPR
jgi:hypothetical protein